MGKKQNRYSAYSQPTRAFMNEVEAYLIRNYGEIQSHWRGQLDLLASQHDIYIKAKEQVANDGLMITNRFGGVDKHPLLSVIKDSFIQIQKTVNQFGLSPSAKGKIKADATEEENNDLITNLLNG